MNTPVTDALAQPVDGTVASSAGSSLVQRSPIGVLFAVVAFFEAFTWAEIGRAHV